MDPVLLCCHHRILGVSLALDASKASGISVQGGSLERHLLPEGVAVESHMARRLPSVLSPSAASLATGGVPHCACMCVDSTRFGLSCSS